MEEAQSKPLQLMPEVSQANLAENTVEKKKQGELMLNKKTNTRL